MKSMMPREHKTGEAWSCIDSIHNLEVEEEDNLAPTDKQEVVTNIHCENTPRSSREN
jgi:hypothetical protein